MADVDFSSQLWPVATLSDAGGVPTPLLEGDGKVTGRTSYKGPASVWASVYAPHGGFSSR